MSMCWIMMETWWMQQALLPYLHSHTLGGQTSLFRDEMLLWWVLKPQKGFIWQMISFILVVYSVIFCVYVLNSSVQRREIQFLWAFITCPYVSALLSSCRGKKHHMYTISSLIWFCRQLEKWIHCSLLIANTTMYWVSLQFILLFTVIKFSVDIREMIFLQSLFTHYSFLSSYLLVDPCEREERVKDGLLVIAMNKHQEICSIQSSGGIMLLKDQVSVC